MIGSHNTMTYKRPKKWYKIPFAFMAKCQTVDYKKQHEKYGVDSFDLRIFWDKKGNIEFRHGAFAYDASDLDEVLKYSEDNGIVVRVFLEDRKTPKYLTRMTQEMGLEKKFDEFCTDIEKRYPNLKLYSGRNMRTWKVIHQFKMKDPAEIEYYSSIQKKWLSLCPFIYSLFYNKKNFKKVQEGDDVYHFDFVTIR